MKWRREFDGLVSDSDKGALVKGEEEELEIGKPNKVEGCGPSKVEGMEIYCDLLVTPNCIIISQLENLIAYFTFEQITDF